MKTVRKLCSASLPALPADSAAFGQTVERGDAKFGKAPAVLPAK